MQLIRNYIYADELQPVRLLLREHALLRSTHPLSTVFGATITDYAPFPVLLSGSSAHTSDYRRFRHFRKRRVGVGLLKQKQSQSNRFSTQKKQKESDSEYRLKVQDTKRNTFSNVIRHLLMFIRNRKVSLPIVENIIEKRRLSVKSAQFYAYLSGIRLNTYIRNKTIKELWTKKDTRNKNSETQAQLSLLFRILSEYYLSNNGRLAVELARKIRRKFKLDHHQKIREIK